MDDRHREILTADHAAMLMIGHHAGTMLGVAGCHPMQKRSLQP